jgi:hypothetical protein
MKIECLNPALYAPQVSATPVLVSDEVEVIVPHSFLGVSLYKNNPSSGHLDYLCEVSNTGQGITTYADPSESVDFSEWPIIRRSVGFSGFADAFVNNGRATTKLNRLDFNTITELVTFRGPATFVSGSYAEYSYNRVIDVAEAVADNRIFSNDSSKNRVNLATFPHQALTGICVVGGWVSQNSVTGCRPVAVTKRHLLNVGHYQMSMIGKTFKWKDVNNVEHQRLVIGEVNYARVPFDEPSFAGDIAIYLLDSDLPDEISPLPVCGEWVLNKLSETADTYTCCPQNFGLVLWGNDGNFSPRASIVVAPNPRSKDFFPPFKQTGTLQGQVLNGEQVRRFNPGSTTSSSWSLTGDTELSSDLIGGKFAHNVRGGDSGSPQVLPVANGWALYGLIATWVNCIPSVYNLMIQDIDAKYEISTGYTVTVAADPTL